MWIFCVMCLCFLILCYFTFETEDFLTCLPLFLFLGAIFPIFLIVYTIVSLCPSISFSEKGVTKTLMGKQLRQLSWDEIKEMRAISKGIAVYIFFSKSELEGLSPWRSSQRKDNIYLIYSEKVLKAIRQYTDQAIIGI